MNADPPSQAAYDADSSKFMNTVRPRSAVGSRSSTTTLANPNQWAIVTASGILHWPDSGYGPAAFHCEIAVDGQVVVNQDATSGRLVCDAALVIRRGSDQPANT